MESKASNFRKQSDANGCSANAVDELAGAMFDGLATEKHVKRLEKMIVSSEEAMREYLEYANIETQLYAIFADKQDARPSRRERKTAA